MRALTQLELVAVSGGTSYMDQAGLNTSGGFTYTDAGDYSNTYFPPAPVYAPTEGIDSFNFFTPQGAVGAFVWEAASYAWDNWF